MKLDRSITRVSTHEHKHCPPGYVAFWDQYFWLPWRRLAEQANAKESYSKTFFLVNSLYTNNVLNAHVHV